MKPSSNLCISPADSRGVPYGDRLKQLRESIGKSHDEMAALVGIPLSTYYDMEEHEGMLNQQTSLGELSKLSHALGIRAKRLFEDEGEKGQSISPEQFVREDQDTPGRGTY